MGIKNSNPIEENSKLSIQVSLNGLSFCALDQEKAIIRFFRNIEFSKRLTPVEVLSQIEKIYEREDFLQFRPRQVEVLHSNELYSLVPKRLFDGENASDFLKFNAKILQTDFVAQDFLKDDLVNVYVPYTNINNYFFDIYGEFEYRHCISILVDELIKLKPSPSKEPVLYINSHSTGFDLIGIKNGQLLIANSFQCETKEDFLYYLLFTAEQLELDSEMLQLVLMGDISKDSEYYQLACSYVRNIEFLDISFGYSYEAQEPQPEGYRFFPLLKSL